MRSMLAMAAALLATGAAAQDISPPRLIAAASGTCTALVNGTDVGCTGKAVHTVLSNGHQLFHFTAKDVTVIGFAGTKLLTVNPAEPSLGVEHVYLDQNKYEADGACRFHAAAGGKAFDHVECLALLRDGRKVSAVLDGIAEAPTEFGAAGGGPGKAPQAAAEAAPGARDCPALMRMHGFLSRAQFQCRYGGYNHALVDDAAACAAKAGEAAFKDSVMSGMRTFDRNEKERGHRALCDEILKTFPSYVRR